MSVHARIVDVIRSIAVVAPLLAVTTPAQAETIYRTGDPFGGGTGLVATPVDALHQVAVRFTPRFDTEFHGFGLWLRGLEGAESGTGSIRLSLRIDGSTGDGGSIPGDAVIESWLCVLSADPDRAPEFVTLASSRLPVLEGGRDYWIVATPAGPDAAEEFGVTDGAEWLVAADAVGVRSISDVEGGFAPGRLGAVNTLVVEGRRFAPWFELDAPDVFLAGAPVRVDGFGVSDPEPVHLFVGLVGHGLTPMPGLGVALSIEHAVPAAAPAEADLSGRVSWTVRMPLDWAGRPVWFQAAQHGHVSDVEEARVATTR